MQQYRINLFDWVTKRLQLEESKNMEAEERARLEAEIHAKREEVSADRWSYPISADMLTMGSNFSVQWAITWNLSEKSSESCSYNGFKKWRTVEFKAQLKLLP